MGIIIPRPQTEKDTTSTSSFAQAFLRKAESLLAILVLTSVLFFKHYHLQ